MRQFSAIEKQIVETILVDHQQMANLVCLFLDNESIQISHANGSNPLTLFIDKAKYKTDKEITYRAYAITEKIVILINLLEYLESHALITYFIPSHGRTFVGNFTKSQELYNHFQARKAEFTGWWFTDKKTEKYLLDHTDFIIHPTEDLKTHVKNKYQTQEEKRHNQTQIATWFAIAISIILGLYGIYQNNNNDTQEIKIEEHQKTEIINAILNKKD